MTPLRISVTKRDISRGTRRSCAACPVALAASRALGERVTVGYAYIVAHPEDGAAHSWVIDAVTRTFIMAFDLGRQTLPFRVLLDPAPCTS